MRPSTKLAAMPAGITVEPGRADRAACELLRAVARRSKPASSEEIDQLASKVQDWDALLRLAQEHRVAAMLYSQLERLSPAIPAGVDQRLKAEYQRNALHSLTNAAELIGLLQAFEGAGIPAMPIKGVVLAASAYGNLTTRPAGDLDVLIEWKHMQRVTAIMLRRDYVLKTTLGKNGIPVYKDNHQYQFERRSDGLIVELHWQIDFVFGKFRRKLGLEWASRNERTALLAGAEVPNMSPEQTLLMLCMHGSKHIWPRLIWICDVAQLLDSHRDLNWDEAIREAKRSGLWRALALGVLLAHRMADAVIPEAILRGFESDSVASGVARHVERTLFDAPGSVPPGRVPYYLRLLSLRDRILLVLTFDFLRPNEKDVEFINLPRPLHNLYWLVHPIRLLLNLAGGK
jgi:Uncharacterised nucleotidyltransferase